jgi:hypothetical protein
MLSVNRLTAVENESEHGEGHTYMDDEKSESEALTASLRALLAINDAPVADSHPPASSEEDLDATSKFTRYLTDLRSGF